MLAFQLPFSVHCYTSPELETQIHFLHKVEKLEGTEICGGGGGGGLEGMKTNKQTNKGKEVRSFRTVFCLGEMDFT